MTTKPAGVGYDRLRSHSGRWRVTMLRTETSGAGLEIWPDVGQMLQFGKVMLDGE